MSKCRLGLIPLLSFIMCFFAINGAFAENAFFDTSTEFIKEIIDFSSKSTIELSATNADPDVCSITFDFTDGNQTIVMVEGQECQVIYSFEDDELLSIVFHMITRFNQISSSLPEGYSLQYVLRFSETEIQYITLDTVSKYYSWLNK